VYGTLYQKLCADGDVITYGNFAVPFFPTEAGLGHGRLANVPLDELSLEPVPLNLLLDDRKGVSHPDAAEGDGGRIYIIYDRERYYRNRGETQPGAMEILMAVVTEQDIIAGKPGPDARLGALVNKATGIRPEY